ncbi:periplasmic heavy metal sensor [Altererythrobacter lauratis]|jgi:nickel and cobalt resistance protein CnrR|uniref:Periplasmic heavy metal sensor n=1 Tax=Alteraurantiacibacter lauratis TaxID=2054627 RepID=A0ABV7EHV5_9SPHN
MTNRTRILLVVLVAFASAIGGVFVGRQLIPVKEPVETELHALLHRQLDLDSQQLAAIENIEERFAMRRRALELEMRADNARLAAAIRAEQGYGPRVDSAVDHSHQVMGELQKATLEHIFEMRAVLRPDQAQRFDEAVTRALTATER